MQKTIGNTRSTFLVEEAGQCPEEAFFIWKNDTFVKFIVEMRDKMQLPSTVIDQ